MELALPASLEQFVIDQVKAGVYRDANEAIVCAVQNLMGQEELPFGSELDRLIAEGQADIDSGDLVDGETAFEAILARNARRSARP